MGTQPRVFHYSLDWRFLIPAGDATKLYLLAEETAELNRALEQVGIPASQILSLPDLKQNKKYEIQSFVMPFGLPADWVSTKHKDQVEFYAWVRHRLDRGGCLLVGFDHAWILHAGSQARYRTSTPRRTSAQLKQAGFQSIQMFGAMPNLAIPEHIFDLEPRTIQFALQNRFRRKAAVLRALRALTATVGWKSISNFLPCYFAVAVA